MWIWMERYEYDIVQVNNQTEEQYIIATFLNIEVKI